MTRRRNAKAEPSVVILGQTGDRSPEHGAGVVYYVREPEHLPGVVIGGPTWEWWGEADERDRVVVRSAFVPDNVFAYHEWAKPEEIARFVGVTALALREASASPNVMARVAALEAIRDYYGEEELDQYPSRVTVDEIVERWSEVFRRAPGTRPW